MTLCRSSVVALAATAAVLLPLPALARPFLPGEELSYEVRLLGVRVGEAQTRVEHEPDEPSSLRLLARGRSVGATESLFKLRQSASCSVDADLTPSECRSSSRKRGKERRREVRFDAESGFVRERIRDGDGPRENRIPVGEGVGPMQEAVSGLYLLRERLPQPGETLRFRSVRKGRPITFEATARGTTDVTTPAGLYRGVELALRILEPQGGSDTSAGTLWISDDARRLPLRLMLEVPVGTLEAILVGVRGGLQERPAPVGKGTPG